MEVEAAQRYAELADAMETHNNREVAALFRTMANIESKHADRDHGGDGLVGCPHPVTPRDGGWPGIEPPEVDARATMCTT